MMLTILKNCLSGFYSLLQDGASTFALLTLFTIAIVTFLKPIIGCAALAAFATVCPAVLAYCNHKITLAQLGSQVTTTNMPPMQTQTVTTTTSNDMPQNGQL